MARAKKTTKKPTRKAAKPSANTRKIETAQTYEEVEAVFPAAREEHAREVKDFANKVVDLIEELNYHPSVSLDAFQSLISAGIGHVLGPMQKRLWDSMVAEFHDRANLLTVLNAIGEFLPEEETPAEGLDKNDANEQAKS